MENKKQVKLEDIHKIFETPPDSFGDTERFTALDGVTLAFSPGEIHTILGENGAGKSTLVHILSGLHQPTTGSIRIGAQELCFKSPSEALSAGIAMVHQRPLLSEEITVLENVLLGSPGPLLRRGKRRKEIVAIAEQWEIALDPDACVKGLTPAQRLYTAMLGALYRKPDFLILDEPSGVLAPNERQTFFESLRRARSRGLGIILITHKLDEAVRWSDRISILRRGRLIYTSTVSEPEGGNAITESFLAGFLDPEPQNLRDAKKIDARAERVAVSPRTVAATAQGISRAKPGAQKNEDAAAISLSRVTSEITGRIPVRDISFTAPPGEITGIICYPGSGLETLEDILTGMIRPDSGTITIGDKNIHPDDCNPAFFRKRGIAVIPSDRAFRGSHPEITITELLTAYRSDHFFRSGAENAAFVKNILSAEEIDARPSRAVRTLSGGQLQRLILARELSSKNLRILVLAEPEWGLDIRSTIRLRQRLVDVADSGKTVLILSDNTDAAEKSGIYANTFTLREGRLS